MKKVYTQPQAKVHIIKVSTILTGSPIVDDGKTSEQNAKAWSFGLYDDEDEYNEITTE